MQNFRNLKVWQRAHQLTLAVYRTTDSMPSRERYGLTAQVRKSCGSIEANLAEGCGRLADAELARFSRIAMGSATETECHLLVARDLGFISIDAHREIEQLLDEVKRMLHGLLAKLESDSADAASSRRAARALN